MKACFQIFRAPFFRLGFSHLGIFLHTSDMFHLTLPLNKNALITHFV